MVKYFFGEDTYAARQAIEALGREKNATIRWLTKDELLQRPLSEWIGQRQSLFGTELVVLKDAATLPKAVQDGIVELLKDADTLELVIWDRGTPDKRTVLFKRCKPYAQECLYASEPAITQQLIAEAKKEGRALEPSAATTLIERVGKDGWRLRAELAKLVLRSNHITQEEVIVAVDADAAEANIFNLLEALSGIDRATPLRHLEELLQQGHSELYIISMLAYQFRTLLRIQRAHASGLSASAVARELKLHPFVVEKSMRHLTRFSGAQLLDILTRVLATDFAIKQGKIDPRTGLLMLVWGITDQAAATLAHAGAKN